MRIITRRFSLVTACAVICLGTVGAKVGPAPAFPPVRPVGAPPASSRPLPPAVIDDTLDVGGEDIKARQVETRMTVEVRLNGRGPFRFLVDSGADSSVVGQGVARDLKLPLGTPAKLNSMTGTTVVSRALVNELSFGPSTVRYLELPVLLERDMGADGLIGIDALVQQRLMMDFEQRVIKVEDARVPAKRLDGEIVVTARRKRGQLILTQVRAGGLAVEAVVDTGSQVTIGNLALRDRLIRGNRDKFVTVAVTGVTGVTINLQLARVAQLQLGGVMLRDVPIAFADVPPFALFGLSEQPALLLGTDILETFRRVSLDFRRRKVRFQLRRCELTGVTISTAPTMLTRISSNQNGQVCRR